MARCGGEAGANCAPVVEADPIHLLREYLFDDTWLRFGFVRVNLRGSFTKYCLNAAGDLGDSADAVYPAENP